jgi:uncharacterized protein YigE (DUF2233 family)
VVVLSVVTVVVVAYLGISLGLALTNQGYGVSLSVRLAEWGRQHGASGLVNWSDTEYVKMHPPKVGGTPPANSFGSGSTTVKFPPGPHLAMPKTMSTPAKTPLPGEGVWHVVGRRTQDGTPTMYEAFVRPDAVHTSYVVGVVWMDPTLLEAHLYSGSQTPGGGPYTYSAPITAENSQDLVAAFNAGLLMSDAHGGYYTQGKTIVPLRKGAASVVVFKDGTMTVGKWGRDVTMSNQVASVRQNLDLIVNNAKEVPGLSNAKSSKWANAIGSAYHVWRSGLGVTKDGALVYVGGPSLSLSDLANILVRAGAVRAMELDINTDWVQFTSFNGPLKTTTTAANGTSLLSEMAGEPNRYFASWWTRDFFTMSLRSTSAAKSS